MFVRCTDLSMNVITVVVDQCFCFFVVCVFLLQLYPVTSLESYSKGHCVCPLLSSDQLSQES